MTIFTAHNYYQYRGGEDAVFESEAALLESRGHHVVRFTLHNDAVENYGKTGLALATFWNRWVYRKVCQHFSQEKPDIVHVHNTLPLISPAIYSAAAKWNIPVVQTLHNYRLLCPNALFFRNNGVCELCLGKTFAIPAILHRCYRGSVSASAVVAGMTALHHISGTWKNAVARYIVLTEFAREKFIEGGLPAEKITVKPNFVEFDPGVGAGTGKYMLYVGRLSAEKGAEFLVRSWLNLTPDIPLTMIGDGPLEENLRELIRQSGSGHIQLLGAKNRNEVMEYLKNAHSLIFPSLLYETFGKSIIEAFAVGTPVICSRLGAMQELVQHGVNGLHYTMGNPEDLRKCVMELWNMQNYTGYRQAARHSYEQSFTAEQNGEMIEQVYQSVLRQHYES